MWTILILIVIGVLLLVAELVLIPGTSVAGICALGAYGAAIYKAFIQYGTSGGVFTIIAVIMVAVAATILSLRAKTWQRLSLKDKMDGKSQPSPENEVNIGDKGVTLTRLAPSGNVLIDGKTYEAKSLGDIYVDPKTEIEVTGFENFTVIVKVPGKDKAEGTQA